MRTEPISNKIRNIRPVHFSTPLSDLASLLKRLYIDRHPTYRTVEKKEVVQCSDRRARSIEDGYALARNYWPDITYEDVENAVTSLYNSILTHNWCTTVKREVHHPVMVGILKRDIVRVLKQKKIVNKRVIHAESKSTSKASK